MARPRKRKTPAGRPPIDDSAALEAVRRIRSEHPRWTYHAAARYYAEKTPSPDIQPASLARRLADKLRREDGVGKRRAMTKQVLHALRGVLLYAVVLLDQINREE